MKKVLFVMVLLMAALIVNAQKDTCKTTTTTKSTTTVITEKAIRTDVKIADLQKSITDNVAKEYVGFTIKEATSVSLNSVITYEVVVIKGTASETLLYDADGKFVQKLTVYNSLNQLRK